MEDYIMRLVMFGVVLWTTGFLLIRRVILSNRSFDFCNRIVSVVHATVAVILASLSVQDWSSPVSPLALKSSPLQMQTLAVSLGYMIYDLISCLFDKHLKLDNCIHHLVSILGVGAGLAYQMWIRNGSSIVDNRDIKSISSLESLKDCGYKDSDLNLAADISFAVIFTIARMIGGPYLTYLLYMQIIPS